MKEGKQIFEEVRVGGLHLRNRLVVIPGTGHTYQGKAKDAAIQVANFDRDRDRG